MAKRANLPPSLATDSEDAHRVDQKLLAERRWLDEPVTQVILNVRHVERRVSEKAVVTPERIEHSAAGEVDDKMVV